MRKVLTAVLFFLSAMVFVSCAYTTKSGLPENIKTIEVKVFGNTTYYNDIEAEFTKDMIGRINGSPGLKVVNSGGDAVLTGEIYEVKNVITEYDANDQPVNVSVSVTARFSLFDNDSGEFLYNGVQLSSSQGSSLAGKLNLDTGSSYSSARSAALQELSKLIVREMVGSW